MNTNYVSLEFVSEKPPYEITNLWYSLSFYVLKCFNASYKSIAFAAKRTHGGLIDKKILVECVLDYRNMYLSDHSIY